MFWILLILKKYSCQKVTLVILCPAVEVFGAFFIFIYFVASSSWKHWFFIFYFFLKWFHNDVSVITVVVWVAACGGVILRPQGHIVLESYPTNARCEWTVQVEVERTVELRWVTFPPSSVDKKGKKQTNKKRVDPGRNSIYLFGWSWS